MDDRTALLTAVLHDPADDLPRLVFADWLEERGEAGRAKLIRCQVERSAGRPVSWDMPRLRPRKWFDPWWPGKSCWSFHNPQWDLMIARIRPVEETGPGCHFFVRRGFEEEIRMPLALFLLHAPALFRSHPVTRVMLTDREPGDFGYGWGWWQGGEEPNSLPPELWHENNGEPDDTRWVRANRADCLTALSLRCVAHGRQLAGLPPLKPAITDPMTAVARS